MTLSTSFWTKLRNNFRHIAKKKTIVNLPLQNTNKTQKRSVKMIVLLQRYNNEKTTNTVKQSETDTHL